MRFLLAFAFVCLLPILANAAGQSVLVNATAGDEITLNDGRILRLSGIHAPLAETKGLADQAREKLRALIADHPIVTENDSVDRYNRIDAQAYAAQKDGGKIWLQGEMLRAGLAFVYPPTGTEPRVSEMLKSENVARQAKKGIWADATYADIPADKAKYHTGHFAFVGGEVMKAERIKNKVYLNFGEDWRSDFTIAIAAHDLHNFRTANIDPLSYEGKIVRVRGWIKRDFGPMVTVTSPFQIEIIAGK